MSRRFAQVDVVGSGPCSGNPVAVVLAVEWVDNGFSWIAVLLESAGRVLELQPGSLDFDLGAVGFHPPGAEAAIEVRAFFPISGVAAEDPVTGSLNAGIAQWLIGSGRLEAPYVANQGTAIGRAGRIRVDQDDDGAIWVGGRCETVINGVASFDHDEDS